MIYAISDCHGDLKQTIKLLHNNNIIDKDGNWIADDSVLINCGDSTDRGSDGIGVYKLFLKLKNQSLQCGGRVIHLCGNHDALILCIALHSKANDYDYEHSYIFKGNGGKMHEAVSLSKMHDLMRFVQSFPLMCRVDGVLFQHADGFELYNRITKDANTPDEKIVAANNYVRTQTQSAWGAWNLFYNITGERFWQNSGELMPEYLESFGAKLVVHGHTGFMGNAPKRYLDDQVINIDAVLSRGYRADDERGCVLVIDLPGKRHYGIKSGILMSYGPEEFSY